VLDAQRQADRADTLLAQSETSLAVCFVALHNALGGGWEIGEASPTSEHPKNLKSEKETK
jgi:outer membrane protein TolC